MYARTIFGVFLEIRNALVNTCIIDCMYELYSVLAETKCSPVNVLHHTVSVCKALRHVLSYCVGLALIMLLLFLMGRKYAMALELVLCSCFFALLFICAGKWVTCCVAVSLLFSSFVLESELRVVYTYSNW